MRGGIFMFEVKSYTGTKEENYQLVLKQVEALITGETNNIANLANTSALLNQFLHDINWVGFYLVDNTDELVLGPFQGLPACIRIPFGRGVCGTSALQQKTLRVANVDEFPGHIACDAASKSEIVVPLIKEGNVVGVLDIDSPLTNRFDEMDEVYLQKLTAILMKHWV
jgi:L-methionine (R)-S-oxide reductase